VQEPRDALTRGAFVASVALLLLVLGLVVWRSNPPAPNLDEEADPRVFSAGRALATIRVLDPHDEPQPVGSAAHAAVRERLIARLVALGLAPEVQTAWSCRPGAVCALVHNVVTRIDGRREGPAVMVAAHYDTVHAAPGAGDDMHGIAILLEIARALTHGERPLNPVVLLATDAEEVGLLGARAFVDDHPMASEIAVAVNVDARGTEGRSNMFETSPGNGPLVDVYAGAVSSPSATSLAYEVYRRMPNDTDFTEFQRAGMRGLNFAFIGGVHRYHTELDRLEHLSPGSVQHQGESALAVTLALAEAELGALDGPDAAYTDVLRAFMLRWPATAGLPIMLVLTLALVGVTGWLRVRRVVTLRAAAVGALLTLGVLVLVPAGAYAVDGLITTLARHPNPWGSHPLAHRCALWSVAIATSVGMAGTLGRRVGAWALACGAWLVFALIGSVAVWFLPGVSPQFVLPTGIAAITSMFFAGRPGPRRGAVATLLPLAVTAVVWLPLALALEEAFGFAQPAVAVLPVTVVAMAWTPLLAAATVRARSMGWAVAGTAGVLVICVFVAAWSPPHSPDRPRRLNIVHHTDVDVGEAFVAVGPGAEPPPESMLARATFEDAPRPALPWTPEPYWIARATVTDEQSPSVDVLVDRQEPPGRRLTLRIASRRGADRLLVLFSPGTDVAAVEIGAQRLGGAELPQRWRGCQGVLVFGVPPEGVELRVELEGGEQPTIDVIDLGVALPAEAQALVDARGERAVQSQWGDASSVSRRIDPS
jgi:hypothetical protein